MVLVGILFSLSCALNLAQLTAYKLNQNKLMNLIGSQYEIVFLVIAGLIYDYATQKKIRKLVIWFTTSFFLLWILNLIFLQKDAVTSFSKLACDIIVLVYCISFFYRLMVDLPAIHLHRLTIFWVTSGFLLYSAGTVFLFAFTEYVIKVYYEDFVNFWILHLTLFILQQIIILIAAVYDIKNLSKSRVEIR